MIINPRVNYFEAAPISNICRISNICYWSLYTFTQENHRKDPQGTKYHIATIFNPFMAGGNKRECILKQT